MTPIDIRPIPYVTYRRHVTMQNFVTVLRAVLDEYSKQMRKSTLKLLLGEASGRMQSHKQQ